jgi:hypothetical protein
VPVAVGSQAYPWLSGNMIIPEIQTYRFEARRRCFNDSVFVNGASVGSLVGSLLAYGTGPAYVRFTYNLGDLTVLKTFTASVHALDVEYAFDSSSPQPMDVGLVLENGLAPDCLGIMMAGRGALRYWDGSDTSWAFSEAMPGVANIMSGRGLLLDFTDPPVALSGDVDVFGLEINPRFEVEIPPTGSASITMSLSLEGFSGVDIPSGEIRQGRLLIKPNPSGGSVEMVLRSDTAGVLTARVFDTRGRLVRTLVGTPAGAYTTATWDGRNQAGMQVAEGIYFIRVSSGAESATGKVTILR